jgi:Rrf2 family transcriptional regulator, nitric oxide-sensitive transcriptional repressor
MRLNQFSDYSLRTLIYCGLKEDELATVHEIATAYQISQNHLVKVVHHLAQMDLIQSFKGRGGGIQLKKSANQINIGDLIYQLEKLSPLIECFGEENTCLISPACRLKKALDEAHRAFYNVLRQYTLEDMLQNKQKLQQILF